MRLLRYTGEARAATRGAGSSNASLNEGKLRLRGGGDTEVTKFKVTVIETIRWEYEVKGYDTYYRLFSEPIMMVKQRSKAVSAEYMDQLMTSYSLGEVLCQQVWRQA